MNVLCLILFLGVVASWFFINEYPMLFGIYVPTCAVRRVFFTAIVAVTMLLGIAVSASGGVRAGLVSVLSGTEVDCQSMMVIMLSTLIILLVLKMFSVHGSAAFAFLGALEAYVIISGGSFGFRMFLGMILAPVLAYAVAALLRLIFRFTLDRCHLHLMILSFYLRHAVIIALALTAFASGFNWGGFLMAGADISGVHRASLLVIIPLMLVLLFFLSPFMRSQSDESAGRYADFSIYSVLAVGLSVAITLAFFSFEGSASLLGLVPVPLSVGSLVFASIAGVETVRNAPLVEKDEYVREIIASVMAPFGALLISYIILYVSGHDEGHIVDFTVMGAAVLLVFFLFFSGYVLRQRKQKEATERLVYSQQQQIYENSRALNDMELKVVLSENQALHTAVEMKKQEVMNVALSIVEQREYLESLDGLVTRLSKTGDEDERDSLISELSASLKQRLSYDRDVDSQYFYAQAESLHEDFNAKLSENFPNLTQQERRLATLLRLGFSSKYIATLMNITPKSVEISRYRLRQKLGLFKGDNLVNYIKSI